jgi:hypothetical protein
MMYGCQLGMLRAYPQLESRLILDELDERLLDFNFHAIRKILQLLKTHNPAYTELMCPYGARPIFPGAFRKTFQPEIGAERMTRVQFSTNKDEMLTIVADRNDIPVWWFDDGRGRSSKPCKNKRWEWERSFSNKALSFTAKA